MSNWQPSSIKFWSVTVLVLLAAAGSLAALWPLALTAARSESASLVGEGDHAAGTEATNDYLLATRLDATNHLAFARLAGAQIAAGQPDAALASLSHAGQGSAVEELKVRTLVELGRNTSAADEASQLTQSGRSDDDVVLAALAYAAAGRTADASALVHRVSSPEAAQRVGRAAASQLTLAAELYAAGLLRSQRTARPQ